MVQSSSPTSSFSMNIDSSTRERLAKLSMERKRTAKSKNERKSAVYASMDNVDDEEGLSSSSRRDSEGNGHIRPKLVKDTTLSTNRRGDLSMSEHTGKKNREKNQKLDTGLSPTRKSARAGLLDTTKAIKKRDSTRRESSTHRDRSGRSASPHAMGWRSPIPEPISLEEEMNRIFDSPKQSSRPSSGAISDDTKPSKKLSNSTPSSGSERESTRGESSRHRQRTGRSASPHALKRRTASPGPMKKERSSRRERATSLGPVKKERSRRSSSIGPLKRPASPVKHRPSPSRGSKAAASGSGTKNDTRTLEDKLGGIEPRTPQKRVGGGSAASTASLPRRGENSRRTRKVSRESSSPRRAVAAPDTNRPPAYESPRRRDSSVEKEMSIGDIGELMLNDDTKETKTSPGRLSQRFSNGIRSFSRLAGFGGSGRSLVGSNDDEPNDTPEKKPESRKARGSTRTSNPSTRSSSAGPLGNRPGMKRTDRRAGMAYSKQTEDEDGGMEAETPNRSRSMMLHRDATRRGKSTSLMDLREYKDEEIHSTSYFASNHVLVNRERMKRGLRPLTRNIAMDEMARAAAQRMSETEGKSSLPATYVGNVLRGESIRAIHRAIMQNKEGRERHNLLSPYFQDFGVGTSKGKDGMLYICQLFSERIELTITDTTC